MDAEGVINLITPFGTVELIRMTVEEVANACANISLAVA